MIPAAQAADGQAAGESAADDNSWPGVAPPQDGSCAHRSRRRPVPERQSRERQPRERQPCERQPREPPAPRAPPPGTPGVKLLPDQRPHPGPLARGPTPAPGAGRRGALAPPRAGRILVLTADAEAGAPCAGRDPGAVRPGGRPRIPAQPFRFAGHPGAATRARPPRRGHPARPPRRERGTGSPNAAAPSPWQRSHQLWTEAGIQWEQRPARRHRNRAIPAPNAPVPPAATADTPPPAARARTADARRPAASRQDRPSRGWRPGPCGSR